MLITKHPHKLSLQENISWMLAPQPTLDLQLFNEQNQIHQRVRQELLFRADVLVERCLKPLSGIEVKDIVLCGSADSYFYHPFSDIDVKIIVENKNCSFLSGEAQAEKFISRCVDAYYTKKRSFYLGRRFIDMRMAFKVENFQGLYSLLNQKWLVSPSADLMSNLDAELILQEAQSLIQKTNFVLYHKFERSNGKYKLEDLQAMQEFHDQNIRMKNANPKSYIINKLAVYNGNLKKFAYRCHAELVKTLSF